MAMLLCGFKLNPSKYGCFKACTGVILFWGSNVIISIIRLIPCSLELGISC